MAINLQKGQKVSLDKGVRLALVGLGWDTNKYDGAADFDLDASAFLLGANGKVRKDSDFIFYSNLQSDCGSVIRRRNPVHRFQQGSRGRTEDRHYGYNL